MNGRLRPVTLAVICAFTMSCAGETLTSPTSPAQLEGAWRLFQMTDATGTHNEPTSAGRFTIAVTGASIQAKVDCNTCSGAASLSAAALTVTALACTRAACGSAPLDTRFTTLISGTQTVRINTRLLQLNSERGELRFER